MLKLLPITISIIQSGIVIKVVELYKLNPGITGNYTGHCTSTLHLTFIFHW